MPASATHQPRPERCRLPLWRKIKWSALAPPGEVPQACRWTPSLVLARLIEAARGDIGGPVAAWPATYLRHFHGQAEVLRVFVATRAGGREFATACRRRGWSRATAYRFRDRALRIIALGLSGDRVPLNIQSGTVGPDQAKPAAPVVLNTTG